MALEEELDSSNPRSMLHRAHGMTTFTPATAAQPGIRMHKLVFYRSGRHNLQHVDGGKYTNSQPPSFKESRVPKLSWSFMWKMGAYDSSCHLGCKGFKQNASSSSVLLKFAGRTEPFLSCYPTLIDPDTRLESQDQLQLKFTWPKSGPAKDGGGCSEVWTIILPQLESTFDDLFWQDSNHVLSCSDRN
ncbi:unnamed protein product [Linum trigynum]|uniref:Uncharacterized protein n=1 Tax=Linum trigynum TaxID=586398 RepID=A0AAV2FSV4_9ROSI